MANRTAKDAKSIKGTNPQYLVEKIIRTRIYDCQYWKEDCFGITAELLVDRAMVLDHVGGHFGSNIKPTPFLCLVLKMLQIQPSKDIIIEFIKNADYKYVRALGAMYLRLTGDTMECYNYLEPLLNDYRKLKRKNRSGQLELIHVDEFVDELLTEERSCDIILPRIQKRYILEQNEQLEPRVSALDKDLSGEEEEEEDEEEEEEEEVRRSPVSRRRRSNTPNYYERDHYHRHRGRDEKDGRDWSRERDRSRERDWSRERGDRSRERGDRSRERGDRSRERGDRSRERGDRSREQGRREHRRRSKSPHHRRGRSHSRSPRRHRSRSRSPRRY